MVPVLYLDNKKQFKRKKYDPYSFWILDPYLYGIYFEMLDQDPYGIVLPWIWIHKIYE